MNYTFIMYSFIDEHLVIWHNLATVNGTVMNMCVQISLKYTDFKSFSVVNIATN
jgi:hypothetical protein